MTGNAEFFFKIRTNVADRRNSNLVFHSKIIIPRFFVAVKDKSLINTLKNLEKIYRLYYNIFEVLQMKLTKLFAEQKRSLSFEVFPPKTDDLYEVVKSATEEIATLKPSFMSVTYGAGGGTSKYTLAIAENIKKRYGVPSIAHLTCVSSTKQTVAERIRDFKTAGIENVLALRGDVPKELQGTDRNSWDYTHAIELVRELKANGDFCVGGACYPEVHPESANQREDIKLRFLQFQQKRGSFYQENIYASISLLSKTSPGSRSSVV